MLPNVDKDWLKSRDTHVLDRLKMLSARQLCVQARQLDWSITSAEVMGWICAQRSVDLGTAMTMFLNARPHRFNHTDREELNDADRRLCVALDALAQRINCGYYLPSPDAPMTNPRDFSAWMRVQESDRQSGRKGRWQFNPVVVAPMISDIRFQAKPSRFAPKSANNSRLFRRVLRPISA
ncbi:MAG: hypothetical protein ACRBBU_01515 [Pseudooceanicola sp.]